MGSTEEGWDSGCAFLGLSATCHLLPVLCIINLEARCLQKFQTRHRGSEGWATLYLSLAWAKFPYKLHNRFVFDLIAPIGPRVLSHTCPWGVDWRYHKWNGLIVLKDIVSKSIEQTYHSEVCQGGPRGKKCECILRKLMCYTPILVEETFIKLQP